jgi:hypothetical protein
VNFTLNIKKMAKVTAAQSSRRAQAAELKQQQF